MLCRRAGFDWAASGSWTVTGVLRSDQEVSPWVAGRVDRPRTACVGAVGEPGAARRPAWAASQEADHPVVAAGLFLVADAKRDERHDADRGTSDDQGDRNDRIYADHAGRRCHAGTVPVCIRAAGGP